MNPHYRLKDWGRWLHSHGINCHPGVNTVWRLLQEGVGAPDDSGVAGDGGLGDLIDRIGFVISLSSLCIETHRAIGEMPLHYRRLVYATYAMPSHRDRPRGRRAAADMLRITEDEYRTQREAMLHWLEHRLDLGAPVPSFKSLLLSAPARVRK